jgi:hypothetical protein
VMTECRISDGGGGLNQVLTVDVKPGWKAGTKVSYDVKVGQ